MACYTLLRPVLQSRQPSLTRWSKPLTLEATRQHVLELERALGMLLDMKNNVIQTLFDGMPPPPRLTVQQYKTLFRGLYPLDAPVAEVCGRAVCGCARPPAADGSPGTPQTPAAGGTPTEAQLAELASLLHDAYDATDSPAAAATPGAAAEPTAAVPPQEADMAAAAPLQEAESAAAAPPQEAATSAAAPSGPGGDSGPSGDSGPGPDMPILVEAEEDGAEKGPAAGDSEAAGGESEMAGGDSGAGTSAGDAASLPDVEENLSLELPSLELSSGWVDCATASESRPSAWQELERAALSLSAPAELDQFTRIQRSCWDLDSSVTSDPAPPESHLSPFSPEMALPAFCSTPNEADAAADGAGATPPPGAGTAKRAGSSAAAAGRRAADRCRRALALGGH
ncbi:hypothetical protein FJT64_020133 [Amphibalanus amphitrite]|uniref:Uncharacterized protein n=1 Tax=Amphibalanus amphitrite TaxID=1232801 RepID=A0A6A4X329_AMPAM|nr:hypothetical protein FJT64_020133 [Amphibalanus amphitrite]